MEKQISSKELAAIKRTAITVSGHLVKREKAKSNIEKWTKEYKTHENTILNYESGLIAELGLRSEQVVHRIVEEKVKDGKTIKTAKYVLNDNVRYDDELNKYIVTIPEGVAEEPCACETCQCEEQCVEGTNVTELEVEEADEGQPELPVDDDLPFSEPAEPVAEPQPADILDQFGF